MEGDQTIGFKVVDWKGTMLNASLDDVIKYAKKFGISNGAVKTLGDTEFISPIRGVYEVIHVRKTTEHNLQRLMTEIWTMEDFEAYMRQMKLKFNLQDVGNGKEIRFNCPEAKVVKYPAGIKTINLQYFTGGTRAEVLILSPTIEKIQLNVLRSSPYLRKIVMQEGMEKLQAHGLSEYLTSTSVNEVVFPRSLKNISHAFNGLEGIKQLKLGHTQLERVYNSFNDLVNLESLELPDSIVNITRGFMGCNQIDSIKMPKNLRLVNDGSFSGLDVIELDFSECRDLQMVGDRVGIGCDQLKTIKFPDGLENIGYNAFKSCERLSEVVIPKTVRRIGDGAFKWTCIPRFVVTKNLDSLGEGAFNGSTEIVFDESNDRIRPTFLENQYYRTVTMADTIREIQTRAFKNCVRLSNIDMSRNVYKIGKLAFNSCLDLSDADLEKCTKLKYIGESAYEDSGLEQLILPESVEEIGNNCFKNCVRMEHVVLPRSLKKIGRAAFQNVGKLAGMGTTFYVYEGSTGHNYCKRNKFRHILIESLDDVKNILTYDRKIDKQQEAKLRLLLSSDETHKELLKPEFINYADLLHKLYRQIADTIYPNDYQVYLNTESFIDVPIDKVRFIDNMIKNSLRSWPEGLSDEDMGLDSRTGLTMRFTTLSNYITSLIELDVNPILPGGQDFMDRAYVRGKVVYRDRHSGIYNIRVKELEYPGFECHVIVIVIGDSIRFVGCPDTNEFVRDGWLLSKELSHIDRCKGTPADMLRQVILYH